MPQVTALDPELVRQGVDESRGRDHALLHQDFAQLVTALLMLGQGDAQLILADHPRLEQRLTELYLLA